VADTEERGMVAGRSKRTITRTARARGVDAYSDNSGDEAEEASAEESDEYNSGNDYSD
jgi:hypothetical protein